MMTRLWMLASFTFVFLSTPVLSEPWLANRFAQNCAGCHAPGRKNVEAMDRRCTLSCQGCHVSPNGGGMRSFYGKWNENRWLASFRTEMLEHDKYPAPYKDQKYSKPGTKRVAANGKTRVAVSRVVTTDESDADESLYARDGLEFVISKDRAEFMQQIPREDPYLKMFENKVDASADVRWLVLRGISQTSSESGLGDGEEKIWDSFPMSVDLGLRWRPVYKRYHIVYEGRYFGSPNTKKTEEVAATMARRSAYVMIDDLPFNTYVMGGYYRPTFGNYVPDHTALSQKLVSMTLQDSPYVFDLNYQALSFGGSPNVPYANVHLISKQFGTKPNETHKGVAVNLGGRFVTLGLSVAYSLWNSQKDEIAAGETVTTRVQMHALGIGAQLWRITTNLEAMAISKDRPNDAFHKGMALTFDTYTQIWRQMYLNLQYAQANMAQDLKPGKISQIRAGAKVFAAPGVDGSLLFNYERNEQTKGDDREGRDTKTNSILWQLHLYI